MSAYLKAAPHNQGMSVPWLYARRIIADRWHCKPWEVDEAPRSEILIELRLSQIEADAKG